jgi:hypothetical protein
MSAIEQPRNCHSRFSFLRKPLCKNCHPTIEIASSERRG